MKRTLLTGFFFFAFQFTGLSQTNNWTNLLTGNWHDLSWSLGIRPLSNQWVKVTNSGSKAVIVNSTTRDSHRTSMTVSNLSLSAPLGATNTVLLNFTGTAVPLTVLNRCYVGTNGVLLNLFAKLTIGKTDQVSLVVEGGTVTQNGGSNICPGYCELGTDSGFGRYNLSNGVFQVGSLDLNSDGGGHYEQSGGQTLAGDIYIGSHPNDASFSVSNGTVRTGWIGLRGGEFTQTNSDVFCSNSISISMGSNYRMSGGSLASLRTSLGEGSDAFMSQSGGTFQTGPLRVGADTIYNTATFRMNGGSLFATEIRRGVGGIISQSGGTISVQGEIDGGIFQSGGLLMSSNTYLSDYLEFTFVQTGGTNITTNTFVDYQGFTLLNGRLDVGNLVVGADFFHKGGTLTNRGQIIFRGGRLFPTLPQEFFGAINVELDSNLIFPSNNCVMRFAPSANIAWDGHFYFGAFIPSLKIDNWKGSTNGGGMHQIIVGTNGLTANQLEQIVFVNPAGLPAGGYNGKILNSGELVPTTTLRLSLRNTTEGPLLRWPGRQTLQSATNVNGPYTNVVTDFNFYRMTVQTNQPKRFFRLKN